MMKRDLEDRITLFVLEVTSVLKCLKGNAMVTIVKNQLFRSATSVGANYQESQAGVSSADFRARISIALKEIRETCYWLAVLRSLLNSETQHIDFLMAEAEQLKKILGSIVSRTRLK